jgi:zinc/manganese transport system permease protein
VTPDAGSLTQHLAELWFLAPALALVLGVLALAPLGTQVLARGVVFIDLAVAQAAAAAALWGGGWAPHGPWWLTQAMATAGALAAAGAVALLTRCWPAQREALIGLLYVLGASAALLGARQDPHGRERLAELLAADVLWAGWPQVGLLALAAGGVLLAARSLRRDGPFYLCFALAASLAVPVLGLFVVFAALIAPALWQRAGVGATAARLGAIGACAAGLAVSWWLDAPSGACVALALGGYGLASVGYQSWAAPASQAGSGA